MNSHDHIVKIGRVDVEPRGLQGIDQRVTIALPFGVDMRGILVRRKAQSFAQAVVFAKPPTPERWKIVGRYTGQ